MLDAMPHLSTLQIGLLVIGALLVLAVWGYNIVQERRIRRRMENAFNTEPDPKLEPAPAAAPPAPRERIEPGFAAGGAAFDDDVPPATRISAPHAAAPEPHAAAEVSVADDAERLPHEPASADLPDSDIECVARLQAVQPIPGVVLVDAVDYTYPKPTRWVGRSTAGAWGPVRDSDSYTEVAACMVLADRNGALNADGYTRFRRVIEELARMLPAAFVMGERDEELKRAAELDAFCADMDIQIGLNLMRKDGGRCTGTRLRGVA